MLLIVISYIKLNKNIGNLIYVQRVFKNTVLDIIFSIYNKWICGCRMIRLGIFTQKILLLPGLISAVDNQKPCSWYLQAPLSNLQIQYCQKMTRIDGLYDPQLFVNQPQLQQIFGQGLRSFYILNYDLFLRLQTKIKNRTHIICYLIIIVKFDPFISLPFTIFFY